MSALIASPLEIKNALIDASTTALDGEDVLIQRGHPGTNLPNDILSWGRIVVPEQPGPISTRRQRDAQVQVYATISVFRPGGPEMEEVAETRCFQIADLISEYVRVTDPTLGGKAFWCFRTNYDSEGSTDPEILAAGRLIEAVVEFTANTRLATT